MLGDIFGVDGIIVLVVVLVVLFGGAAIPKLARNLGSAKNEFEKGLKESTPKDDAAANGTVKGASDGATQNPVAAGDEGTSATS